MKRDYSKIFNGIEFIVKAIGFVVIAAGVWLGMAAFLWLCYDLGFVM